MLSSLCIPKHIFIIYFSIINKNTFSSNQLVKGYFNLEPRVSASYQLDDQSSIKASYNKNTQNIHLLSNSTSSTPTDLYVMSSNNIKPEISDQLSTGYFKNFDDNIFEFSAQYFTHLDQLEGEFEESNELSFSNMTWMYNA